MATIPVAGPQAQLRAAAPTIGTPNTVQDIRGTQGAFGQQTAQATAEGARALAGAGDDVARAAQAQAAAEQKAATLAAEAQQRLRNRENSIRRVSTIGQFETKAQELVTATEAGGNLADANQATSLRGRLSALRDTTLASYQPGDEEDRLILEEDLLSASQKFDGKVVDMFLQAGRAAVGDATKKKVAELATIVATTPGAYADARVEFMRFHARNVAGTETPEQERASLSAGLEALALGLVEPSLALGSYDEALRRLGDPTIGGQISADKALSLRIRAHAGLAETQKSLAGAQSKLALIQAAGVVLTPEQTASVVSGINLTGSRTQSFTDQVREAEAVIGQRTGDPNFRFSGTQVEKMRGAFVAAGERDPTFGKGTKGLAREFVADTSLAILENREVPAASMFRYLSGVAELLEFNQETQAFGQLDSGTRAALTALGLNPDKVTTPEGVLQLMPVLLQRFGINPDAVGSAAPGPANVAQTGTPAVVSPDATGAAPAAPAGAPAAPAAPAGAADTVADRTRRFASIIDTAPPPDPNNPNSSPILDTLAGAGGLFGVADLLTGPGQSIGRGLAGTTVIGQAIPAPQMVAFNTQLTLFRNNLVEILQRTEQAGNAERQSILKEQLTALTPGALKDPSEMRNAMIGLDEFFERETEFIDSELAREGSVSGERGRTLLNRKSAIAQARQVMGVPPLVVDPAQFKKLVQERGLAPAAVVRFPSGKVVTVKRVFELIQQSEGGQ